MTKRMTANPVARKMSERALRNSVLLRRAGKAIADSLAAARTTPGRRVQTAEQRMWAYYHAQWARDAHRKWLACRARAERVSAANDTD